MIRTPCPRTIDPNSTPLSLRCYFSASNFIYIVDKTSTKMLDKFTRPGSSVITKDTEYFFDVLPLVCNISTSNLTRSLSHNADEVLVFPVLLHIHFVDNQLLEFHLPFYSKFLSGMMQAIQIHNNQHFNEELVLGTQYL